MLASNRLEDRRRLAIFFGAAAIVVVALYSWMVVDHYTAYLDWHLRYVPHEIREAREDVLGFGFWPMWLMVFFIWLVFEIPAYLFASKRSLQLAVAGILFLIVSVADFYLAGILTAQVPT